MRLQKIKLFWSENGTYQDGAATTKGPVELNAMIQEFRNKFPNSIMISNPILSFNNYHTWSWAIINEKQNLFLDGRDYVEVDDDNKITKLVGFWGKDQIASKEHNLALVKTYYESLFKKQDFETIHNVVSEQIVYYQAEGLPYGGIYNGFNEMMGMFGSAATYFDLLIEKEPVYFTNEADNKVSMLFTIKCTSKKSGASIAMEVSEHFELKDGKIISIRPFYHDTKTFSEFLK